MAQVLDMPQLSETMQEGVLRRWLKNEGEPVNPGDVLAEVETDKATMEWEAQAEGTLLKRLVNAGVTVSVGSPVAIVGKPGDAIDALVTGAQARLAAKAPPPLPRPTKAMAAGDRVVEMSPMRKTIARRVQESNANVPHFYLTGHADMDAAMDFRDQASHAHRARVSVNDLVLKACALALRKVPQANASFGDEGIVQHARVDIAMAVAIDDGLVTPIIRDADKKTLAQLGNEAHELAARARDRKLRTDEMTGATFSVTNLGMFGIDHFAAIINPPEAAILAVGRVRREPVVKDGKIVIGRRMSLTLSCDHRVIDGAVGAKLLQAIVALLEQPAALGS